MSMNNTKKLVFIDLIIQGKSEETDILKRYECVS